MRALRLIARPLSSVLPDWLVKLGRRLLWSLGLRQQPVSADYQIISSGIELVGARLSDAWKDRLIPGAQRAIVDAELERMYKGDVVPIYRVLADSIQLTGCENAKIVEVGCASGHYSEVLRYLLGHVIWYMGIDYSEAMIVEARRHYPDISFAVGDTTALPLSDGACDVLISGTVILHVQDYEKAIAESVRVTREWVVFHRTPVVAGPTIHFTKLAYGVKCIEIAFGEDELLDIFREHGLSTVKTFEIAHNIVSGTSYHGYTKTYVCRK
jgi:ubiquinone/menaquinone biosynthesis C-methylase UbiE